MKKILLILIILGIGILTIFIISPWETKATTDTFYSGQGDGYIQHITDSGSSWSIAHDAVSGTHWSSTSTQQSGTAASRETAALNSFILTRGFFPFDTSALPDNAVISSSTLYVYVFDSSNTDDDGDDWVNVVQTTQASSTILSLTDYNECGATSTPTEGATRIDITNITTSSYVPFRLNTTGRGWISKTGYTLLGIREGHDALNSSIADNKYNGIGIRFSEYTGTSYDPYLEVEYSTSIATLSKLKLKGETLKIKGGVIKIKGQ